MSAHEPVKLRLRGMFGPILLVLACAPPAPESTIPAGAPQEPPTPGTTPPREEPASPRQRVLSPEDGERDQGQSQDLYSDSEMTALTTCVLHADVAAFIADRRRAGQSEAEQLEYFATRPNPELHRVLVEDMYARQGFPFDMVHSFLQDCVAHLAEVGPERRGPAVHCLARAHIANLTARYKQASWSEQRIADHFAVLDARDIVARAYAYRGKRVQAALAEWRQCISPLSANVPE